MGLRRTAESLVELGYGIAAHGEVEHVALLADETGHDDPRLPAPGERHEPEAVALVELVQLAAGPRLGERALDEADGAAGVGPLADGPVGEQPAADLVGRPRHG